MWKMPCKQVRPAPAWAPGGQRGGSYMSQGTILCPFPHPWLVQHPPWVTQPPPSPLILGDQAPTWMSQPEVNPFTETLPTCLSSLFPVSHYFFACRDPRHLMHACTHSPVLPWAQNLGLLFWEQGPQTCSTLCECINEKWNKSRVGNDWLLPNWL